MDATAGSGPLHLLALLYFMVPAYLANMSPPLLRFWPGWNPPIDLRRFGAHKTVLGVVVPIAVAVAATATQAWLQLPIGLIDYAHWLPIGLGFGVGVAGGDLSKSYAKRRLRMPPGARWIPFDQLDFVVGALVLVAPFARLGAVDVGIIVLVSLIGDLVVNRCAYLLRIKTTPW